MGTIKSQTLRFLGPVGGYQLCRILSRSIPKILMYHRFSKTPRPGFVDRESFESQIVYLLENNFHIITLGELVESYQTQSAFPANAVVISVDDGYSDFYDIAFPILEKHKVTATLFVTTRFIDGDFWLWPDSVRYILEHSYEINLGVMPGGLKYESKSLTDDDRSILWNILVGYLLSISEDEKNSWLDKFTDVQNVKLPEAPVDGYCSVNWAQVKELDEANIEIGAHTQSHPSLGRLGQSQLSREIGGAVDIIEQQLGHRPMSFCFPNGQPPDYTAIVKKQVENAGCQSAVTAFYDQNMTDDLFELRRFSVSDDWQYFLRVVNGADALAAKWLKTHNIMKVST